MKAHKFTICFIDFENYGKEAYEHFFEHMQVSPMILESDTADIGEWSDDHILNQFGTPKEVFEEYFKKD
jgi:hypothetical protein